MGQIVFWLEAAITSLMLFILGVAILARIKRPVGRWLFGAAAIILVLCPWVVAVGTFALYQKKYGWSEFPLYCSLVFAILLVISAIVVLLYGYRKSQQLEADRVAGQWKLGKITLLFLAGVVVTGTTFWNLDLAVRQEMAILRAEAGAISLSASPPRIPDSQNAAVLYRQAYEMLDASKLPADANTWMHLLSGWKDARYDKSFNSDNKDMLAFLKDQVPVIALLRRTGQMQGCNLGLEYNPPSPAMLVPEFRKLKGLSNLLSISSTVNVCQNRLDEAMEDITDEYALAAHCSGESLLISLLVGMSIEEQALDDLQYALNNTTPTLEAMENLKINPSESFAVAFQKSMRMEEAMGLTIFNPSEMVQLSEALRGEYHPAMSILAVPYRVFLWANDVRSYRLIMTRQQRFAASPYYEVREKWMHIGQEKFSGGLLSAWFLPALESVAMHSAKADAQHRLSLLAGAMVKYRLKNRDWPDKVELLLPNYLSNAPVDPFTGKGMKILKDADGGIILYSLGPDNVDDGGKPLDKNTMKGDISITLKKFR